MYERYQDLAPSTVSTMVNTTIWVACCVCFPIVTMRLATPRGLTASPVNPTSRVVTGLICAQLLPNLRGSSSRAAAATATYHLSPGINSWLRSLDGSSIPFGPLSPPSAFSDPTGGMRRHCPLAVHPGVRLVVRHLGLKLGDVLLRVHHSCELGDCGKFHSRWHNCPLPFESRVRKTPNPPVLCESPIVLAWPPSPRGHPPAAGGPPQHRWVVLGLSPQVPARCPVTGLFPFRTEGVWV
ncbi:hypothetical protein LIER_30329 [Lithospermum erythrorhizon]|uniref:Uncharacterized protein n=1 Tax=Lithospermum erythrorhizon TaxID=34254 RepID=A0AAV3RMA2_LITER